MMEPSALEWHCGLTPVLWWLQQDFGIVGRISPVTWKAVEMLMQSLAVRDAMLPQCFFMLSMLQQCRGELGPTCPPCNCADGGLRDHGARTGHHWGV